MTNDEEREEEEEEGEEEEEEEEAGRQERETQPPAGRRWHATATTDNDDTDDDGDADGRRRRRRAPLLFRSQLPAQARIRFKPYILMRSGGDRPAPVHPMAPANHTMHGEVDRCIDGPRQPRCIELIDVEDG